jgi:hypothetical protein
MIPHRGNDNGYDRHDSDANRHLLAEVRALLCKSNRREESLHDNILLMGRWLV